MKHIWRIINLLLMLVNLALGAVNLSRGNYLVGAFGIAVAIFIVITNFRQSTHTILGYLAFFLLVPIVWIVLKAWNLLSDKCEGCKQPLEEEKS